MISPKDKAALRNQLWQTLDQLSKLDQDNRSQKIQIHLKQFLIDHTFNLLGGFVPVRKEPNIWPLLEPLGPSLALPVYNPTLDFYEWGPFKPPLKQSKFNIPEPATAFKTPPTIEACLVPALGIDNQGNRIGWGHGYFDRLISKEIPIRIGVIYEAQKINATFTPDPWDIPLTHIITEHGLKKLRLTK